MAETWRGLVRVVLDMVRRERALTDEVVARAAHALVAEPILNYSPEDEYKQLALAVHSGAQLTDADDPHGEAEFRGFLTRVLNALDGMRPWPEPAFQTLYPDRWAVSLEGARVVGRITEWQIGVEARIRSRLHHFQGREIVFLLLAGGLVVGVAGGQWAGSEDLALLSPDRDRPGHEIAAAFTKATGVPVEEVGEQST